MLAQLQETGLSATDIAGISGVAVTLLQRLLRWLKKKCLLRSPRVRWHRGRPGRRPRQALVRP
ncbi:hypothetical protein ACFXEL_35255 [Streptomyces sp. NPDC059382]|uniref:hypothetical protein n=1 Tax=Streptomyces sp. NPDC059382 TaxID=3346816 RepID=UPI00367C3D80